MFKSPLSSTLRSFIGSRKEVKRDMHAPEITKEPFLAVIVPYSTKLVDNANYPNDWSSTYEKMYKFL